MVFQSWRKKRSEDHDTWSESCCCYMRGEGHMIHGLKVVVVT
ncbi:unnamed protein product [Brassica oleracea]|uniref:Uncharacterized protein n=2 Tax=Brassica TaxID=3705 RepID=A0A3P6E2N5_BRAOL|nr:unnamed protein product [Brassica napus]VDD25679.1 unnamed protein product [Brassica oleracea]